MNTESLIAAIKTHIDVKLRVPCNPPKIAREAGIYLDYIVRETVAFMEDAAIRKDAECSDPARTTSPTSTLNQITMERRLQAWLDRWDYGDYEMDDLKAFLVDMKAHLARSKIWLHDQEKLVDAICEEVTLFERGSRATLAHHVKRAIAPFLKQEVQPTGDAVVPDSDIAALNKLYEHVHGLDSGSGDAALLHRVYHYLLQYRSSTVRESGKLQHTYELARQQAYMDNNKPQQSYWEGGALRALSDIQGGDL